MKRQSLFYLNDRIFIILGSQNHKLKYRFNHFPSTNSFPSLLQTFEGHPDMQCEDHMTDGCRQSDICLLVRLLVCPVSVLCAFCLKGS